VEENRTAVYAHYNTKLIKNSSGIGWELSVKGTATSEEHDELMRAAISSIAGGIELAQKSIPTVGKS
jgi:hypothetical protein